MQRRTGMPSSSIGKVLDTDIDIDKGDMLLVMGDFNAKVGRRKPSAIIRAWAMAGGEMNEAGELEQKTSAWSTVELAVTMFKVKQHLRRLYTWTSPDGNARNQRYISSAQNWKTSLMNFRTPPGPDCDSESQAG